MRIGILTFHRADNCGAALQAWALQTVLQRMGHQVLFPDGDHDEHPSPWPFFRKWHAGSKLNVILHWVYDIIRSGGLLFVSHLLASHNFKGFQEKHLCRCQCVPEDFPRRFDLLVVGSDQVWNRRCSRRGRYGLFLGKGTQGKMVAYAVSAGDSTLTTDEINELREAVRSRFSAVSFREGYLRDIIAPELSVSCDPTLLLTREDYAVIEEKANGAGYLLVYALTDADQVLKVAINLGRMLGVRVVCAGVNNARSVWAKNVSVSVATPPEKFLALFRDAKFVVVSSFHGCVFSCLYRKCFVCLYDPENKRVGQENRQQGFLRGLGIEDRRLSVNTGISEIVGKMVSPYDVDVKLADVRQKSLSCLEHALNG